MDYTNFIKVFLPFPENSENCRGETVWAEKIGGNRARIDNHPVGKKWHGIELNDVVEYQESTLPTSAPYTITKII